MTNQFSPELFLSQFFGQGNGLNWASFCDNTMPFAQRSALAPWIERVRNRQSPYVLPRVTPGGGHTVWYVLADSSREARSIRESLLAFVGPSYTAFDGQSATFDASDPIDAACHEAFAGNAFKLAVSTPEDRPTVSKLLALMIDARSRIPRATTDVSKPVGRLLRDLEVALVVGNRSSALRLYEDIRSRGRLNSNNLRFLEVRIYGGLGEWNAILDSPHLNDLLQIRRPKQVSETIAIAVYRELLSRYEAASDPVAAIEAFKATKGRFYSLFRSITGFTSPDAIKAAIVCALSLTPANLEMARRLAGHALLSESYGWCQSLLQQAQSEQEADIVSVDEQASIAFNRGDYDHAFDLILQCAPTFANVARCLEVAIEIDSDEAARKSLAFFDSSDCDVQQQLCSRRLHLRHLDLLKSCLSITDPSAEVNDWLSWFSFVDRGEHLDKAQELARRGSREWNPTTLLENSASVQELSGLLRHSRSGAQRDEVRNALPFLLETFLSVQPTREAKPIYFGLLDVLIYDDSLGADDLMAIETLLERILTVAPSVSSPNNDFSNAVDITEYLWDRLASPRNLDWVMSIIDLLIQSGGTQHASVGGLFTKIASSLRPWVRRINDEQWTLLSLLADDLAVREFLAGMQPEAPPDDTPEGQLDGLLRGKSIAVYSLTERIATRFGQLATQVFDGIKLSYCHDKSLTDRLKSIAHTADIFVVNTWDAKHAATIGIRANRPVGAVTLEPGGKTASALLRCLVDFARATK